MKQILSAKFLFNFIFIAFVGIFLQSSCRRVNIEYGVSNCIHDKIIRFSKYTCKTGANVIEYNYHSKLVYVFTQGNCADDLNAEVVDADCITLGFVSKSAHNLIEGDDFYNANFSRIIWEDK